MNGKNWVISLSGTAHNDSFDAEVNSPPIVAEIRRRQAEDNKVRAQKEMLDARAREKQEADLKRQQQAEIRAQQEAKAAQQQSAMKVEQKK